MSQMVLSAQYVGDIHLNVTSFSSPIFNAFNSGQTKNYLVHFPLKTNQPNIRFAVQFSNEGDYELFQNFIRKHHIVSIGEGQKIPEVTLDWPERDINQYTGFITKFKAGGRRFNVAPTAEFSVELVKSMVSEKTRMNSFGSTFESVYGPQINDLLGKLKDYTDILPSVIDSLLKPPKIAAFKDSKNNTLAPTGYYTDIASGSVA